MTGAHGAAPLVGGVALLERAINYTLGSLQLVTPTAMPAPSPCRGWDLRALLRHMNDSLAALHEGVEIGRVDLGFSSEYGDPAVDPVATLRNRACRLLGAWTNADHDDVVSIGDYPMWASILTSTGALEIAVHGWDVARACGRDRPIPPLLAEELLRLASDRVTDTDRLVSFAAPVDVSPLAGPGDRLVAFLGRSPA